MSMNVGAVTTENYNAYETAGVSTEAAKAENVVAVPEEEKVTDSAETKTSDKENNGVVYEQGTEPEKKAAYSINKMSAEDRAKLVERLKQDELDRRNQLSSLVQQMFSKQAGATNLADLFSPEKLKNVSAEDIAKAKEDIAEDGYWGVKQTSQRLFDFASALAGDDVENMKKMQHAMERGFKEATAAWGKDLPKICKDTLDAANKLFDDYYASKGVKDTNK